MNTQYQLCFYSGSLTGKIFPIVKEETKIGRDASCDIVLTENSVSRIHVFLYVQQNGSVVLVDNNSTNGTVVNNYQISAPVQLSENDVIGLGGDVMLVFQKAANFEAGSQWNGTDMPAGNAPDSYNFEKKQGNPMSNENNNTPSDGAMSGFAPNGGQDQQPAADNFGFNQAYNTNANQQGMNPGTQNAYGFGQPNPLGQIDINSVNNQMPASNMPMANDFGVPVNPIDTQSAFSSAAEDVSGMMGIPASDPLSQQQPVSQQMPNPYGASQFPQQGAMGQQMNQQMPYGSAPYGQQPMQQQNQYGYDPYGQQPMMGQQAAYNGDPYSQQMNPQGQQMNFNADPLSQQMGQQMGQQMPYVNDPYSQQMGQQMPYGNDPYGQQPMNQQMPYGNDPYGQQPMNQQMPYGNDPYGQQQMGQQMPYGNDPYGQQQMGQQMPYGNDPYGQQQMGQQMPYGNDPYGQQQMGQQMPYGNDPYGQQQMGQQMPYGNDPYGQQQMMGQQMPYGNNPYAQQQMMGQQNPYGNNPYGQQYGNMQGQPEEDTAKAKKKKTIIILAIVLAVLLLIGAAIFYIDHNRLWCDVFPFLWDADTCANYVR